MKTIVEYNIQSCLDLLPFLLGLLLVGLIISLVLKKKSGVWLQSK